MSAVTFGFPTFSVKLKGKHPEINAIRTKVMKLTLEILKSET